MYCVTLSLRRFTTGDEGSEPSRSGAEVTPF